MKQGFVKVAAVTPELKVADVWFNTQKICERIEEAYRAGAKIIVFPELCITGYTCGDLFAQNILLKDAKNALSKIADFTNGKKCLVFVGLPYAEDGALYNVAAAINNGEVLGLTTKTFLPNYGEFYEMRQFSEGPEEAFKVKFEGKEVYLGPQIIYQSEDMPELLVSAEVCEDVWALVPPSTEAIREGAVIIANCSASDETVGKDAYRKSLISSYSARTICGYIYANAGDGESTTDLVFGGHDIIAECGSILGENNRFSNETVYSEIDVQKILSERRRNTTFRNAKKRRLPRVSFAVDVEETVLTRKINKMPFVPKNLADRQKRCEEILMIQAMGLKKRLVHAGAKSAVVGISGGLDSTLALLVTAKAFDLAGKNRKDIVAVTMPCFGTTDRTYKNACLMSEKLGATLKEVRIADAVKVHFNDIGHDINTHDVTFENSQARERTQVLMDIANKEWGMVIGTGDMSELALGWATYNGDHMSMYGVNASVPKTLVRHLVEYYADSCEDKELQSILKDVLDTPVSPELLPPKDGEIAQITEDLVGPYELHDFFMYQMLRFGYEPRKIYRLAKQVFEEEYSDEIILKWLKTFVRRFFTQQFKRSCLPDGPKIGSVALSPRGDLRMPSDACMTVWMKQLDEL